MKEPSVGVAAVPGVPMSIAWCQKCLKSGVVPLWTLFAQVGDQEEWPEDFVAGRFMFASWWLEIHDATLEYFGVTDEEFWTAVNDRSEDEQA